MRNNDNSISSLLHKPPTLQLPETKCSSIITDSGNQNQQSDQNRRSSNLKKLESNQISNKTEERTGKGR